MSSKLAVARAYLTSRFPRKANFAIPDIPICDEAEQSANFSKYNVLGISLDEARKLAKEELETGKGPHPGYSFGLSSGSTGEPGVFITTQAERDRWLGNILGKFISPGQLLHLNVALLLKHNNRLYSGSNRVHYFDSTQSAAHWAPRLCDIHPNVLIGPPSVLLALAHSAAFQLRPFQPHTLLSAAEPLFPQDRARLTAAFKVAPQNLYQAKEGFLAAGCPHGGLHWNQDLMALELMRFRGRPDRAVPVITDFTRQSQKFRRYRIDDVLVMGLVCPCRTPLLKFSTVEGRLQDVLLDGGYNAVFPLDLNEILSPLGDFTLSQHSIEHFTLECSATPAQMVLQKLNEVLRRPARLEWVPIRIGIPGQKRRRFQRLFDPNNRLIVDELLEPAEAAHCA